MSNIPQLFWLKAYTFLFVALKLCSVIDWSWWLVFLPVYGGVPVVVCLIAALSYLAKKCRN